MGLREILDRLVQRQIAQPVRRGEAERGDELAQRRRLIHGLPGGGPVAAQVAQAPGQMRRRQLVLDEDHRQAGDLVVSQGLLDAAAMGRSIGRPEALGMLPGELPGRTVPGTD